MTITDLTPDPEGIDPVKAQRLLLWSVGACAAALCVAWLAHRWARRAERAAEEAGLYCESSGISSVQAREHARLARATTANPETLKPSPSGEPTDGEEPARPATDGGPSRN